MSAAAACAALSQCLAAGVQAAVLHSGLGPCEEEINSQQTVGIGDRSCDQVDDIVARVTYLY